MRLNQQEIQAIEALPHEVRRAEPGQYLMRDGDRPKHSGFLAEGFAYRHKFVGDGGRQIVSVQLPGDWLDLQNLLLDEADHNVQALTPVLYAAIEADALVEAMFTYPAIGRALWWEALVEASIFREWIANIGRRDARGRMAHLLCELAERRQAAGLGSRHTCELPMTQEQLGDALGLTAVHVNRTLKTIEQEGLSTRSKRSVTIASWDGLRDAADFTSAYLHLAA